MLFVEYNPKGDLVSFKKTTNFSLKSDKGVVFKSVIMVFEYNLEVDSFKDAVGGSTWSIG